MKLEPLTEIQQKQVIEKRLGKDAVETLWQRVTGLVDSEGQSICANPLMLSMVISIFKKDGDFAQIDSRFALYDLAVKMMLTRVDFKQIGQRSSGAEADHVNLRLLLVELAAGRQHARTKDIVPADVEKISSELRPIAAPTPSSSASAVAELMASYFSLPWSYLGRVTPTGRYA